MVCKKPDERLVEKIKEHKKEIKEQVQTLVPHLNGLAEKDLRELAASDKVHKNLESLL